MLLVWRKRKAGYTPSKTLIGAIPSEHRDFVLSDLSHCRDSQIGFQPIHLGDYHADGLFNESEIEWNDPVQ